MINSKDSRNAWREIAEAINNKFKTNKTADKCLRKIKYLIDAYKEKKNGTEIRPVVTYESLFSMMKLMPFWVAVMP